MNEVAWFSLLFAAVSLLLVGLGVPLVRGKVAPNTLYGCRTRRTLSDPKLWYEANRSSGRDFLISGAILLAASLAALAFARDRDPARVVAALLAVLLLCVLVSCWRCLTAGRRR